MFPLGGAAPPAELMALLELEMGQLTNGIVGWSSKKAHRLALRAEAARLGAHMCFDQYHHCLSISAWFFF